MRSADVLAAYDGVDGRRLWQTSILGSIEIPDPDLFVIEGVVWPGVTAVNKQQEPERKGDSVLAIGYDLRTGVERQRLFAPDVLRPEHHHRCYRNKATDRYVITSMEGAEFIDLQGSNHSQNNSGPSTPSPLSSDVASECRILGHGLVRHVCFARQASSATPRKRWSRRETPRPALPLPPTERCYKQGPSVGSDARAFSGVVPSHKPQQRSEVLAP